MERKMILMCEGLFWSGDRWVSEYPDAQIYFEEPSQKSIDRAFHEADQAGYNGGTLEVAENYGLVTEKRWDVEPDYRLQPDGTYLPDNTYSPAIDALERDEGLRP